MGCGPSHCQKELCLIQNTDIFKDECKFFCPFWRLYLPFQPPQSTYLCTFTKKYIILASLVLPPNMATLRNHLVHPVDQISSGYSVSFLQVTSTIIHQTSTYHSVSRKEMENVYFFVCTSEIFLWLDQKHNDYMGLIQTAKIHVEWLALLVCTWEVLGSVLPNFSVHLPLHPWQSMWLLLPF